MAIDSLHPDSANFDAQYAASPGMPTRPPKLPTFTITPRSRSSIRGRTASVIRTGDSKFTRIVSRTSSSVSACTRRRFGMAALLTSTSSPPMSSHAWRTSASAASVSPRSAT